MKRTTLAICFTVVCSLALVLYAQAPPPAQTPPAQTPAPTEQAKSSPGSTTLTGCLKAGTEPDTFILTNISGAGAESAQKSAPGELAKADVSYKLSADSSIKLKDHVGHKVEVTGTLGGGKGFTATPPASSEKPSERPKAEMANFKVSNIKHISPSCP
jgi:hypothetical protein